MTPLAPLCPRIAPSLPPSPSHTVTFLCKCLASDVTARKYRRQQVRSQTCYCTYRLGNCLLWSGQQDECGAAVSVFSGLRLSTMAGKQTAHGLPWKGNGGLCWFRLVKTSPAHSCAFRWKTWARSTLVQLLRLEITRRCQVSIVHHEKWLTRSRYGSRT